jgi:hypothetical protein
LLAGGFVGRLLTIPAGYEWLFSLDLEQVASIVSATKQLVPVGSLKGDTKV